MPKVSVIMPVYNVARYLREGVASVLKQTMPDLELILVDDGSTDGSASICDECAAGDARVHVIHQANGGVARARNAGLAAACGQYLMFCDPDDRLAPDSCRRMTSCLETNAVDAVVCRFDFLVEDGVPEESVRRRIGDGSSFNDGRPGKVRAGTREKFFGIHVTLCNKIYRMSVIRRYALTFPPVRGHEDDAFWLMYAMASGDVLRIPDRLYVYRLRSDSITAAEAEDRPCDRNDLLSAFEAVAGFAEQSGFAESFGWVVVRTAYNYYRLVSPFFSAEELSGVRRRLVTHAAPFCGPGCRLVESNGDLVHVGRRGTVADAIAVRWHLLRAWLFRGDARRRNKALARAERSRLLWNER